MSRRGRPYKVHDELDQLSQIIGDRDHSALQAVINSHGIDAFDRDNRTALIWASFFGQADLVKWLLDNRANVNFQDGIGFTGLHYCGQEQYLEIATILLKNGADPNITDKHGNTALWTSLFNAKGNFEVVRVLVLNGADPILVNVHGRSTNDLAITIYKKNLNELLEQEPDS